MALPAGGPTTDTLVKAYMEIPEADASEDARLETIVPAVNAVVRALPVAEVADADPALDAWPAEAAHVVQGATMLAARLLRRHNSPDGVASFGDQGPVYVQRNDPDIAMLLQLGQWSSPAVG